MLQLRHSRFAEPSLGALGRSRSGDRAFSLVEVVVAIGIVAFAVLAILGALPVGLNSVRNAETMQATGNIANQLRGQVQLLSFNSSGANTLQQLAASTLYYSTDGVPTTSASGNAYYRANFVATTVSPQANAIGNVSLSSINAQSLQVNVAYPPGAWNQTNTFSLLVARQTDN